MAAAAGCTAPPHTRTQSPKTACAPVAHSKVLVTGCTELSGLYESFTKQHPRGEHVTAALSPSARTLLAQRMLERATKALQQTEVLGRAVVLARSAPPLPTRRTPVLMRRLAKQQAAEIAISLQVRHHCWNRGRNWLWLPSYLPGIVVLAPLWSPFYTAEAEIVASARIVEAQTGKTLFNRPVRTRLSAACNDFRAEMDNIMDRATTNAVANMADAIAASSLSERCLTLEIKPPASPPKLAVLPFTLVKLPTLPTASIASKASQAAASLPAMLETELFDCGLFKLGDRIAPARANRAGSSEPVEPQLDLANIRQQTNADLVLTGKIFVGERGAIAAASLFDVRTQTYRAANTVLFTLDDDLRLVAGEIAANLLRSYVRSGLPNTFAATSR